MANAILHRRIREPSEEDAGQPPDGLYEVVLIVIPVAVGIEPGNSR